MRLIDADALIDRQFKNDISYNAFRALVQRQPTIDAVPVIHGEWVTKHFYTEGNGVDIPFCTACKKPNRFPQKTPFCPNCGAKMDGGKE